MTLRRSSVTALTLFVSLAGGATFAQIPNPGWIIVNPSNPRYLEIAPPNGFPFSIASYGSLTPCTDANMVNEVARLGRAGATYARLWSHWVCDDPPDWSTKPWRGPWALCDPAVNPVLCPAGTVKWDLTTVDEQYWSAMREAIRAARAGTPRLAVEVQLFRRADLDEDGARGKYNPLKAKNNINDFASITSVRLFMKVPYLSHFGTSEERAQYTPVLGLLNDYVTRLVSVTQEYGNVIYEIMNEPPPDCANDDGNCADAKAYFTTYWADFIKARLADYDKTRLVAQDQTYPAFDVPQVDVVTVHAFQNLAFEPHFLTHDLNQLSSWVRDKYLESGKVVNLDEFGNGAWDPAKLRKESWTIITSGGHFHIEDPCDSTLPPAVYKDLKCDRTDECRCATDPCGPGEAWVCRPPNADAKPWNAVKNINNFRMTSGWQFYRSKPIAGSGAAQWFYWMVQGDPDFDTVGFANAGVVDHVGYLASRPADACTTEPLLVNLPALPAGAPEYVAWLWDPSATGTDNYLRDAQGKRLEYRFTWAGGDFDWCGTPFRDVILSRAYPSDDLVFHVHGAMNAPVILSVTKLGIGNGTVVSTAPDTAINCGSACSSSYPAGTSVTLRSTPDAASTFGGWSGGGCSGTQPTCTTVLVSSQQVSATFNPILYYKLAVTKAGTGAAYGSVTSSPTGISCGATCSASYPYGTVVTLSAAARVASVFAGWGGACAQRGTQPTCELVMTEGLSVSATFTDMGAWLTVSVGGTGHGLVTSQDGRIACGGTRSGFILDAGAGGGDVGLAPAAPPTPVPGPVQAYQLNCAADYLLGSRVTLTAVAVEGSLFVGWSGACSGTQPTCTLTMNGPKSVSATMNEGWTSW